MHDHKRKAAPAPVQSLVFIDHVWKAIESVRERFEHEQDQALRKQNLEDARWSLAQRDAADQIKREIEWWIARQTHE